MTTTELRSTLEIRPIEELLADLDFWTGRTKFELYPKDIDCFYMPLVDEAVQTGIDALVRQSFTLKAESERLLELAKRAVEIAIEQDEEAAISFLATTAAGLVELGAEVAP